MTYITYKEFVEPYSAAEATKYPSLLENISNERPERADELIAFVMNAGQLYIGTTAHSKDILTGEDTGMRGNIRQDEEYSWPIDLAYYVDRYNLMLPDDFVEHILSRS